MKILCVSDQIDPLVYSAGAKDHFKDVDIILCAGDLAMEYIDYIVSTLNKPTYFVFGNHNLEEFGFYHQSEVNFQAHTADAMSHYHGAIYCGFNVKRENKLIIAGCSGSMKYNKGLCQYTEGEMKFRLIKMIPRLLFNKIFHGRYLDIFLTHASPLGIHDKEDLCHKGYKCYRWFLNTFKPKYMVHGHIHLYDQQETRVTQWEQTTIINAFSHYLIDEEKNNKEV